MDYCTLFPEGWWAYCCQAHDLAYSAQIGKDIADQALFQCVATSNPAMSLASVLIGGLMYAGVHVFGKKYYKSAANDTNKA